MDTFDMSFVMRVLEIFAMFPYDTTEQLTWRCDDEYGPITFLVNCSDTFTYACADCEPLTPETLPVLESAIRDLEALDVDIVYAMMFLGMLYAARVRGVRPMGQAYPGNEQLWALFDACGPEREPVSVRAKVPPFSKPVDDAETKGAYL